jgi:hypothetical protein
VQKRWFKNYGCLETRPRSSEVLYKYRGYSLFSLNWYPLPFHHGSNITPAGTLDEITYPMTGHRTIFHRGGSLSYRHGMGDFSMTFALLTRPLRTIHDPRGPKLLKLLLFSIPPGPV